jgi:alpha-mannosidase
LLRFYEWAGTDGDVQITVPKGATAARLTNLMEKPLETQLPLKDGEVTVPVHPYEIVSVRLSRAHERRTATEKSQGTSSSE